MIFYLFIIQTDFYFLPYDIKKRIPMKICQEDVSTCKRNNLVWELMCTYDRQCAFYLDSISTRKFFVAVKLIFTLILNA